MKTKIILLFLLFSFVGLTAQDKNKFVDLKKRPQPLKMVPPVYPEEAKKAGKTGEVVVQILVGVDGKVKEAKVLKSDNDIFNNSAMDAAKKMILSPGISKEDKVVEAWVAIPFKFRLEDKKTEKK